QGVFSIFFYTKKMLVKFTNIKKYRADRALCQIMLVKRNLRIIWTEQKEEHLFLFCLFGIKVCSKN
ncbi:hypothetical protein EWU33_13415, partial [Enterococcus faecium]